MDNRRLFVSSMRLINALIRIVEGRPGLRVAIESTLRDYMDGVSKESADKKRQALTANELDALWLRLGDAGIKRM